MDDELAISLKWITISTSVCVVVNSEIFHSLFILILNFEQKGVLMHTQLFYPKLIS